MKINKEFEGVNGIRFAQQCICNMSDIEISDKDPLYFVTRLQSRNDQPEYRVVMWHEDAYWHAAIVCINRPVRITIYRCPSDIESSIEAIIDLIDDKMDEYGYTTTSRDHHDIHRN